MDIEASSMSSKWKPSSTKASQSSTRGSNLSNDFPKRQTGDKKRGDEYKCLEPHLFLPTHLFSSLTFRSHPPFAQNFIHSYSPHSLTSTTLPHLQNAFQSPPNRPSPPPPHARKSARLRARPQPTLLPRAMPTPTAPLQLSSTRKHNLSVSQWSQPGCWTDGV